MYLTFSDQILVEPSRSRTTHTERILKNTDTVPSDADKIQFISTILSRPVRSSCWTGPVQIKKFQVRSKKISTLIIFTQNRKKRGKSGQILQ